MSDKFELETTAKIATLQALLLGQGKDVNEIKNNIDKINDNKLPEVWKKIGRLSNKINLFIGGIIVVGFVITAIISILGLG